MPEANESIAPFTLLGGILYLTPVCQGFARL